jgi:hypothetical protein
VTAVTDRPAGEMADPPAAGTKRASQATWRSRLEGCLRPSVVDPLVVGVVAMGVYSVHGYDGVVSRDFGVFLYGGEHVAQGVPPYVGIFNSVGPLADALPGLAIWVGKVVDVNPVLAARAFYAVLAATSCALVCVLARRMFASRVSGLVAPAVFLTFPRFLELASDGPRDKTAMLVFLLLTLVLLERRRWLLAGVFTALATLTWQPALTVAVAAAVAATLLERQGRTRSLLTFILGGAIPSAVTVALFSADGALRQAIDGFIVVNAVDTTQPSAVLEPVQTLRMLWTGYHGTLVVALAGLAVLIPLGVHAARRAGSPAARALVIASAGAVGGTAWTAAVINGSPDLFVLLPFSALGATALLTMLAHRLRGGRTPLLGAIVATALVVALAESVATRNGTLVLQRDDVADVLGTQPADASVVSIAAPQVMAIGQRDNPSPWQLFDPRMQQFLSTHLAGGLPGYAARIDRLRPTFIVVGAQSGAHWLERVLESSYWPVGQGPGWRWYLSRAAGPTALADARAANARAMADAPPASRGGTKSPAGRGGTKSRHETLRRRY